MHNRSGKVLTIFLVIFAVLLVSITAIAVFLFQKETERRKDAEGLLAQTQANQANLEKDLQKSRDQITILIAKNKEADDKINGLLDELELEKGLREETKKEAQSLRDSLQSEAQTKEKLSQELTAKLDESQHRIAELESQLSQESGRSKELGNLTAQLQDRVQQLESKVSGGEEQIELGKIIVSPSPSTKPAKYVKGEGRVLTVDAENQFVIVNLGQRDGVAEGTMLSVFRGEEYLGDLKVSRVQPDMSAADFIPPLASQNVSKNDRVVKKQ